MKKVFKNNEIKIDDNVVKLNINDTTVEKVIDFYNEAPFPNYENKDDIDIIKMWDDIVENTKNKLGQSLRYFYMSHHGHITTGKLYNAMRNFYDVDDQYLKEYKNKSKQDRYLHLVLELEKFTSFFQQITDVTQNDQVNKIFSLFGGENVFMY